MVVALSRALPEVAIVLPGMTDSALAATSRFDLAALESMPVELFGPRGLIGSSVLRVSSQTGSATGCVSWPTGSLAQVPPLGWRVAFEKGRAVGLPLDSLEGMGGADSTRFVASVLQALGSLGSGGDPAFRGIPYFVRKGYRLNLPSSSVRIAEAVRRINEEANPREEHLFLLVERAGNDADYRVAFQKRSAGAEEAIETSEILAAVRFTASNRLAIVMTFDFQARRCAAPGEHQLSSAKNGNIVSVLLGIVQLVCDEDDAQTIVNKVTNTCEQVLCLAWREDSCRLIEYQHPRIVRECFYNLEALLSRNA